MLVSQRPRLSPATAVNVFVPFTKVTFVRANVASANLIAAVAAPPLAATVTLVALLAVVALHYTAAGLGPYAAAAATTAAPETTAVKSTEAAATTAAGNAGVSLKGVCPDTVTLQTEYDYVNNTQTPPDVQIVNNVVTPGAPSTAPSAPDWQFRLGFQTSQARRVRFTLTFQVTDLVSLIPGDPVVLVSGLMLYFGVDDGLSRLGSSGAGYGS